MENIRIDTPVMLLFFNRPEQLKQVFEWVKKVKPQQLFLVQDGARQDRPDDKEKILKCREIVSDIDWECEVHKNYAKDNLSCDEREFSGISWCFQYVDRLIILEDDCVPSNSFYNFCGELLKKYENDERVYMISGFNRVGVYEGTPYDYAFSQVSAGWGWATWKRVWDKIEQNKDWKFFDDKQLVDYYSKIIPLNCRKIDKKILDRAMYAKTRDEEIKKVTSWEQLVGVTYIINNGLCITPKVNMIKYIGVSDDATHCVNDARLLTKKVRRVLTQSSYELKGELFHPPFVVRDKVFEEEDYTFFWKRNKFLTRIESLILKIKYRDFKSNMEKIKFLIRNSERGKR